VTLMLLVRDIDLFYGASQALRRAGLTAQAGAITCVLGRNGVGKSSLMRAIVGQQAVRSGTITWEGADITRLAPHRRAASGIAYVPQGREIFPLLTVEENLRTGLAVLERGERRLPAEVFDLFPVLKSMLRRRGGDLSGGQQQQLAIGRALVSKPRFLILDEPTEGIQPNIVRQIGDVILHLNREQGLTVLLVEQKLPFARRVADHFCILDRGRKVAEGAIGELDAGLVREHLTV
jgi:urea transport system ATP-binding protein